MLPLTFLIVGSGSVFALPAQDSSSFVTNTAPFGAMSVNEGTCTNDGGNPDNDGICNNWKDQTKHNGLHISFNYAIRGGTNYNYTYNLACDPNAVYANPGPGQYVDPTGIKVCPGIGNKDIYVELDWMHGQAVNPQAIADVVNAFYIHGIHLHVQYGEDGTSSGDIGLNYCNINPTGTTNSGTAGQSCSNPPNQNNVQSYPLLKKAFFGTASERNPGAQGSFTCPNSGVPPGTYQGNNYAANCLTAKMQVFHYAMAVIFQAGNPNYSGWSERWGNDFLISLGNFQNGGDGNIDEQEASFMHELGHNLALDHGGSYGDQNSCKPNYLSVMNYIYQFRQNADSCRPLDYSTTPLASLNQANLADSNVGSYPYPSYNPPTGPDGQTAQGGGSCPNSGERPIWWSLGSNTLKGTTGVTNDWNNDGQIDSGFSQVLNNVSPSCNAVTTTPYPTLSGNTYDDWTCIKNGGCGTPSGTYPMNFRSTAGFIGSNPQAGEDPDFMGAVHQDIGPFVLNPPPTPPTPSVEIPVAVWIAIVIIIVTAVLGILSIRRKK